MIYSRFGTRVKEVVGGNVEKNEIDVIFETDNVAQDKFVSLKSDVFKGYIQDFKADDGITEIAGAIEAANKKKRELL